MAAFAAHTSKFARPFCETTAQSVRFFVDLIWTARANSSSFCAGQSGRADGTGLCQYPGAVPGEA